MLVFGKKWKFDPGVPIGYLEEYPYLKLPLIKRYLKRLGLEGGVGWVVNGHFGLVLRTLERQSLPDA